MKEPGILCVLLLLAGCDCTVPESKDSPKLFDEEMAFKRVKSDE